MPQIRIQNAAKLNKWDTRLGHSPIADFAKAIYPAISDEVMKFIDEQSFIYNVKKMTHLLKAGDTCRYLFLITKGSFRGYVKQGSKELVTWITLEGEMITSIRGLYSQGPSIENIQAIEDSELVGATYEALNYLYENHPEMNIVGRKLLEKYCVDAEERSYTGRLSNATTKFQHFMNTKAHVADRVPLKYIASYLGMTEETLSRIRNNKLAK